MDETVLLLIFYELKHTLRPNIKSYIIHV